MSDHASPRTITAYIVNDIVIQSIATLVIVNHIEWVED